MKEVTVAGYTYRCVNEIMKEQKLTFVEFIAKTFETIPPLFLVQSYELVDEYKDTEVDKVFFAEDRICDEENEIRSVLEIADPNNGLQRYLFIETGIMDIPDIIRSLLHKCLPLVTTKNSSPKFTTNIKLKY
jgi:hypothetical protein